MDPGRAKGACTEPKHQKPVAPRGLERPATTQPTCCPQYPPGSTLLECRLEGDQPVAHVVQVPADGDTATQKMSLLVETKLCSSGPYSRVISRPIEYPQDPKQIKSCQNDQCNGPSQLKMAYRLESRECEGGPIAMITKVPVDDCSNAVMTLETTKGEGQPDGPSSKILYGPGIGETVDAPSCAESPRNLPATMIDCSATAKHTSARITRCLRNGTNRVKSAKETSATPMTCSHNADSSISCLDHKVAETRVDESGPKAYVANLPQDIETSRKKAKSTYDQRSMKVHCDQPKRKKSETSKGNCAPAKCLRICPGSNKAIRPPERRNGLDPEDNLPISLFRRIPRKQVCPCSPSKGEHRPRSSSRERGQRAPRKSSDTKLLECVLLPCSLVKKLREGSQKPDRDCTEPKVSPKICEVEIRKAPDCTKPKQDICKDRSETKAKRKSVEDCSKDFVPEIRSQELLTRFRDYFSPHQLQRYEVCRSRRNGLQDQCQLAIPRAVIELKKKEMLARDSPEKSDRAGLTQPIILVCADRKPVDCESTSKEFVESPCA